MNIVSLRLYNQHISQPRFDSAAELVKWMGAIQAQDYAGSLWAMALRLKNNTADDIETAVIEKKIVRSWPMRGTLHFVAANDLRWMLQLLAPRVLKRAAGVYRQAGLDSKVFTKSKKVISAALEGGNQLTRNELYDVLERARISSANQRGLHILGNLAQQGLICFGPRNGKQQTFVLLDEWLPPTKIAEREEALIKLSVAYFRSHGPATAYDFAWWSGLTLAEVKMAIELAGKALVEEKVQGQSYWMVPQAKPPVLSGNVFLLPAFDEYLVAYKDRSLAIDSKFSDKVKTLGNGLFTSPLIVNGRMAGVWKRSVVKDAVVVNMNTFEALSKSTLTGVNTATRKLGKFLRMPVRVNK